MDESAEYDNLLKSVFNSCDQTEKGYLTPYEFEDLCSQLCLEDNQLLLQKILFKERSKLGYEQFREVLLLLLAGSLTDSTSECAELPSPEDQNLIDFDEEPLIKSPTSEVNSPNNINEKEFTQPHHPSSTVMSQSLTQSREDESKFLVIEFEDQNEQKKEDSFSDSFGAWSPPTSSPIKKYGRRSSPDEDLLRNNETYNMRIGKKFPSPDELVPITPPAEKIDQIHPRASAKVVEEYVGEGDGSDWINPDHDISMEADKEVNNDLNVKETDDAEDAQKALASVWQQTVGNFDKKINLLHFQYLFRVQAPATASDDIEKLFEVLDDDKDGLITYADFSLQMSVFMTSSAENSVMEDQKSNHLSFDSQKQEFQTFQDNNNLSMKTWPLTNTNVEKVGLLSNSDVLATSDRINVKSSSQVSLKRKDDVTTTLSSAITTNSKKNATRNIPEIPLESSAIDSIVNDAEDTMQRYHGAPPYRRRRRLTQPSLRHQNRRSSRIQSLPYYHPMSKIKVEDCPLFFLTEGDENYVLSEKIRNLLNDEGIDDADTVFQELGLDLSNSFNVEILANAFEAELKENPVHYALCVLYKNGISYYKSQNNQEASEKKKIESMLKLLDAQMEEQEERIEKLEAEYRDKVEATESRYKNKLARLKIKMETEHDKQEQQKIEETKEIKRQIEKLKSSQVQLQKKLGAKEAENLELSRTYLDLERQLKKSKTDLNALRTKFDRVYDQALFQNQSQADQHRRLDQMLEEYRAESKKLNDQNDELLEEMKCFSKQWNKQQVEVPPVKEDSVSPLTLSSNEDPVHTASIQSSTSTSQLSISPITKLASSPSSSRYINKISFTPSAKSALLSESTKQNKNKGSIPTKASHVSTFLIKSSSLSGNRRNVAVKTSAKSSTT